ncbi:MAG: NAD(P)/FAD-dependent oxidoreductase [Actinomycetes bacterium]
MTSAPSAAGRRPRVVVVGGGFAGLSAVRELSVADVDVLLLDRNPYNTFQPLLYQVATGGLNPGDVTYALRAFAGRYRNASFRRACVTGIDHDARLVHCEDGTSESFDYLVLCPGVTANYFGVPGAEEHAQTIYTRRSAIRVRDSILSNLEMFAQGRPSAKDPVTVVVGGGPTGVEMAGALAELRNAALPVAYREVDPERVRVVLVEMTDTVLGPFAPRLQKYTAKELRQRGVELRLGTSVKEVREDSVLLSDGEELRCAATIWATGVKVHDQVGRWGLPQGRGGRIVVGPDLRVQGRENEFAVGDVAAPEQGAPPQLAQPAIQGGRHAAIQIRRLVAGYPTEEFHYKDKGIMATIGRSDAVVQLPWGPKFGGFVAWLAWVALHIVTLVGNRNRFATMTNLSVRYLAWPGSMNVIVGDPPD